MPDAHKNFAVSAVATAPTPAASGTSLVVTAGHGSRFPAVPFNATICPANADPTPDNAEIVRVTNVSTDTFTITRAQETSAARTVVVGDRIYAAITAKTLTDVEALATPNYLVGTADANLSGEIVVGTTPGGELGGTWASPTVDATHSGSAHHAENHASRHATGGADAVTAQNIDAAPDSIDFLVGTASGDLTSEIVVGTSPGGELGGTWASPTVDASHSGSTHAATQAAAEATAASALSTHAGASDPHTGYLRETWLIAVRKTASESVTSSAVLQNDDHLAFSAEANAVYRVAVDLYMTGNGGDVQVAWSVPAGASGFHAGLGPGITTLTELRSEASGTITSPITFGDNAGAGGFLVTIRATISTGGTAGTVTLQWAQLSSSANATTVLTQSPLVATRVA